MKAEDDTYVATGCPGGLGHWPNPGRVNRELAEGAISDLIDAARSGDDLSGLEAVMFTMCQCALVEVIDILVRRLAAADPHDVVA